MVAVLRTTGVETTPYRFFSISNVESFQRPSVLFVSAYSVNDVVIYTRLPHMLSGKTDLLFSLNLHPGLGHSYVILYDN